MECSGQTVAHCPRGALLANLERNVHVFADQTTAPEKIIRRTWQRIGTYIRLEWKVLLTKVRRSELTLADARERMELHFGTVGILWSLDDITNQIQPRPP